MRLIIDAICDVGRVRSSNEDMLLIGNNRIRDGSCHVEHDLGASLVPLLLAVADGMGGQQGGKYASEIVLSRLSAAVKVMPLAFALDKTRNFLGETLMDINAVLLEEGTVRPDRAGMGSTLVAILFYGNAIISLNIGDSRLYRLRGGILTQLSRDHSLVDVMGDSGLPKNIILRSLGASKGVHFDMEDMTARFGHGDAILLCSDGLTNELSVEEMEAIVASGGAAQLVNAANEKGGRDNISVITARLIE